MRLATAIFTACMASAAAVNSAFADACAKVNQICKVAIIDLHPTQFNIGQREVNVRAKKFAEMKDKKLDKYIESNPAQVVLGPHAEIYIVDHHHMARALDKIHVKKIKGLVLADFSSLNMQEFWREMQAHGWVLLTDNGVGPLSPFTLPTSIAGMTDDPYRSLAWAVNSRQGYADTDIPYADFYWADFFRTRVDVSDFKKAIAQALDLAHSPEARGLPGYIP